MASIIAEACSLGFAIMSHQHHAHKENGYYIRTLLSTLYLKIDANQFLNWIGMPFTVLVGCRLHDFGL